MSFGQESQLHPLGKALASVWEYGLVRHDVKYPTQKPIALLERIIKASSNEGDVVLDPFCGSGTTLRAAKMLVRKYIDIDQNHEAIRISGNRLNPPQGGSYSQNKGDRSWRMSN